MGDMTQIREPMSLGEMQMIGLEMALDFANADLAAANKRIAELEADAELVRLIKRLPENWRIGWEVAPPYGVPPERPCWFVESYTGEVLAESLQLKEALEKALGGGQDERTG